MTMYVTYLTDAYGYQMKAEDFTALCQHYNFDSAKISHHILVNNLIFHNNHGHGLDYWVNAQAEKHTRTTPHHCVHCHKEHTNPTSKFCDNCIQANIPHNWEIAHSYFSEGYPWHKSKVMAGLEDPYHDKED